ncbi:MAG: glycosyltransferase [Candidatus Woesearchaeota archaeon]|jgi:cellulose synthase/poly-beta-1,6-N-acetylglucosamine synthase-like glycosyltransferase|nr:glycosyltransferase [Candidatus Woesearchaeota archaeon]
MKLPKVTIIIPFKELSKIVEKCITECQKQDYKNYEILLLPDNKLEKDFKKCRVIPTGPIYPSEKRNIGVKESDSQIIAFIDSDAYPDSKDWIKNTIPFFQDKEVAAVGGPNHVPPKTSLLEKTSADVIYSNLCAGGNYPIRKYKIKGTYEYKEIATSNLFVRKDIFEEIGGFDPYQLTSEDSKLCFNINKKQKKVIFTPNVAVYHKRRPLFWPHTKRVFTEGRNKAFLFKESFSFDKLFYFLPSLFVLGVVIGFILALYSDITKWIYLMIITIYLLIVFKESIKLKPIRRSIYVFIGIILTHLSYGSGFIKGILTNKYQLKKQDQLRRVKEQK